MGRRTSSTSTMLRPLDLRAVTFAPRSCWGVRLRTNLRVTLPRQLELLRRTGRIDAFKLNWRPGRPKQPHYFWDSDVAKWVEAASYAVSSGPRDRALERALERVSTLIAAAQRPGGYLNVYFTVVEPQARFSNLRDRHELYCAGHLIEAAVAHFAATGKRTLLDPLVRYADMIAGQFGPSGAQSGAYDGHEEIELALVKLYRATGEAKYLRLAKHFLDVRGQRPHFYDRERKARGEPPGKWEWSYQYHQAHAPVRQQREVVGHAVRAMYLCTAMADVAAETGDTRLRAACRALWRSATERKMYVTGAIGSQRRGESFGPDYVLPNKTAYAETCAAIGLVFFAERMSNLERDAKYADVIERALYNVILASASLDGSRFFYENPLASEGAHHRQDWFDCACCPPNYARLLASLGAYVYAQDGDRALFIRLYAAGTARATLRASEVAIAQRTRYPWGGRVDLRIDPARPVDFDLMLRIPGWCREYRMFVNGRRIYPVLRRGYAQVRRTWRRGDRVQLELEMPVQRVAAGARVRENIGRVALQRGPIVYCIEQCDQDFEIERVRLPDRSPVRAMRAPHRLGDAVALWFTARIDESPATGGKLYAPLIAPKHQTARRAKVTAIPYFLWDNRSPGSMAVWLPRGR